MELDECYAKNIVLYHASDLFWQHLITYCNGNAWCAFAKNSKLTVEKCELDVDERQLRMDKNYLL